MHALIVDDDRGTAAIVARQLKALYADTLVAHEGETAWSLLSGTPRPSLAIVDWMLPGIDGLELCRRIRKDAALAHMYVILLTGRDSRADLVAGLDAGADDYIVKPFDGEELRARVQVGIRVLNLQERLADRVTELQSARDELARLASTDSLTNLLSRRRWLELATTEFDRYRRYNRPLSLLVTDLDFFKTINDTHGHDVGDQVLREFADLLRLQSRASDVVGRLGGEEFAVLLPETAIRAAGEVAQRIVESCRDLAVPSPGGWVKLTCSIGVTEAIRDDRTLTDLVKRADEALYQSKREGRNRWHPDHGKIGGASGTEALEAAQESTIQN